MEEEARRLSDLVKVRCQMGIAVKSAADVAAKYAEVTPGRQRYYENGVKNPKKSWSANTTAASPNFRQAVTAGNIEQLFVGGVRKAGDAKWSGKSGTLGVQRFGPGVQAAKGDYETNVTPYLNAIGSITLPPRQPRGSAANLQRVQAIADRLSALRLATKAGGSA